MKTKFCIFFLLTALLYSCKDDDATTDTYIGTWIGDNEDVTSCTNPDNNSSRSLSCTDINCYRLTFNDDGTFTFKEGLPTESGTWLASGTTITFCSIDDGEQTCRNITGTVQGEVLSISFSNEDSGCATTYSMTREATTS